MKSVLFFLNFFLFTSGIVAQKITVYDFKKSLSAGLIKSKDRQLQIENLDQREVLVVNEENLKSVIWLNDISFKNGTVELDMKGRDGFQRSFIGIAFHVINDTTYEAIYFRPPNFRATDSVRRVHAVQYINHPKYTWEKLRTEFNAQ